MKNNKSYEFSFSAPIDHLLVDDLDLICKEMSIELDKEKLLKRYFSTPIGTGNVLVYFAEHSVENFIMFDIYRGFTDQCDMVNFGLRCNEEKVREIKKNLINIYKDERKVPRSKFVEEIGDNLKKEIEKDNFPKLIKDIHYYEQPYTQEIEFKPYYQEIEFIVSQRRQ